jgi:F-type H+-transporting ATPase subunit a
MITNQIFSVLTSSQFIMADAESDGPVFPTIADFLPDPFLFEGTFFAMNRLTLIRLVMLSFILIFFSITCVKGRNRARAGNLLPTKPQSAVEELFKFVKGLVHENLSPASAKKWYPMALTLFCSIVVLNLSGIIPALNLAATAGIGIPLIFALWVFSAYWREGIKTHGGGLKGAFVFVKNELFPPGLPVFIYPLYAPLELLQLLIIRPGSLAIRLFANMLSGHILVAMCYAATQYFVIVAAPMMKPLGLASFVFAIVFVCFELLVAVLQAYVFTLLMCVYIGLSDGSEHAAHDASESNHIEEQNHEQISVQVANSVPA